MCFLFFFWLPQHYMIAATQGLSKEPTQESAKRAASFLEACNLLLKKDFWAITGLIVSAALLSEISKKEWPFLRNGVTATKKQVTLGTVCLIYLCYIQCFILIGYMCRGSFYFPLFWGMVMYINGKLKFKLRIKLNQNIILYKDVQKKNWCRLHEVIIYTSELVHRHTTSYEQKWSHSSDSKWKVKFKLYTLIINYIYITGGC